VATRRLNEVGETKVSGSLTHPRIGEGPPELPSIAFSTGPGTRKVLETSTLLCIAERVRAANQHAWS
jgi:hypothetical protein